MENADFSQPNFIWLPFGVTALEFYGVFLWRKKIKEPRLLCKRWLLDDGFHRLNAKPACDGRTDRPTDASAISVSRSSCAMLTHNKSMCTVVTV